MQGIQSSWSPAFGSVPAVEQEPYSQVMSRTLTHGACNGGAGAYGRDLERWKVRSGMLRARDL